jgi:hypothetical protein
VDVNVAQVRLVERGFRCLRLREICTIEASPLQVRLNKERSMEVRVLQIGIDEDSIAQVRRPEVCRR